jgi:hypothetical protein
MPGDCGDLLEWFADLKRAPDLFSDAPRIAACIELVTGYVPGSKAMTFQMFNFGKGVGHLEMAMAASVVEYAEVSPSVWQKALGVTPRRKKRGRVKGESDAQWKTRLADFARRLYPDAKVTKAVADALLIARYCRLHYRNKLR